MSIPLNRYVPEGWVHDEGPSDETYRRKTSDGYDLTVYLVYATKRWSWSIEQYGKRLVGGFTGKQYIAVEAANAALKGLRYRDQKETDDVE
jgi:hypothetical protein